ncbi:fibroblast growth factor receptor 3-like [Vanessa cardui]|uniref:fibroblast growth factor receptor 3-like n=1 Tax=Vanessa cardui TaxID=171605 RepID=UPI001F12F995|nr:fibroblast growth factor receptor 3-like [Vanessa cardui]
MMKWQSTLCCVMILVWPENASPDTSFTGISTILRGYIGRTTTSDDLETRTSIQDEELVHTSLAPDVTSSLPASLETRDDSVNEMHSTPHFVPSAATIEFTAPTEDNLNHFKVQHAALPRGVQVTPQPLVGSDHELMFNVTWNPPTGPQVREYSLEVHSMTDTVDCRSNLCYEYNIPGESLWSVIPAYASPVPEGCAVRPGCAYLVKLIAHPWDGHTVANLFVELDECVAKVCSCAHAPRLPTPNVSAKTLSIQGELFVNVTWTLPKPKEPRRLPPRLKKSFYFVSIGKQMVSDIHPAPWFAYTISRRVDAVGFVVEPDGSQWQLLPVTERSSRSDKRSDQNILLDVKLLARVSLVDERGCIGPPGNTTAYDPANVSRSPIGAFALWAAFGGACVLAMVAVLACSARAVKRVLNAFRPTSVSTPLQPLGHRPLWFPLGTNSEIPCRGQMEESPLYVHKEFETEDSAVDHFEVSRSRVHLGALIGSGAFGRVHAAQLDMPGGETITVAAKMLSDNATEEEMQDFLREIAMLKHVGSHKHVIRLIACCTRRSPLIALLEHAPRGDLLTLLRAARGRRHIDEPKTSESISERGANGRPSEADTEYTNLSDSDPPICGNSDDKLYIDASQPKSKDHYVAEPALQLDSATMREYALQVALGMQHLEERGITHRDLAARNILVDGAGVLKVADFGLSRSGVYVHTRSRPVPLRWLAPEAIYNSKYWSASDVWAFAVLLWEIATLGGFPYAELSNREVPQFLTEGGRLPKPARASPRLYQLMTECWSENAQDRPTFSEIVEKLTVQQQLYVDLDCVFPPIEDNFTTLSDYDFTQQNDLHDR